MVVNAKYKIPKNFEISRIWNGVNGKQITALVKYDKNKITKKLRFFIKKWLNDRIADADYLEEDGHFIVKVTANSIRDSDLIYRDFGKMFGSQNVELLEYGIKNNTS